MHEFTVIVLGPEASHRVTVPGFRSKDNAEAFLEGVDKVLEEAVENNQIERYEITDVTLTTKQSLWTVEPTATDVLAFTDYLLSIES